MRLNVLSILKKGSRVRRKASDRRVPRTLQGVPSQLDRKVRFFESPLESVFKIERVCKRGNPLLIKTENPEEHFF